MHVLTKLALINFARVVIAKFELQLKGILLAQVPNVDVLNTLALQDYVKMYARTCKTCTH